MGINKITQQVVANIQPELTQVELKKLAVKRPENLSAWDQVLRGMSMVNRHRADDYKAAHAFFQAAIELEMAATGAVVKSGNYPFTISGKRVKIVKPGELIEAVIADIKEGIPVPEISLKFHNTMAEIILQMCRILKKETENDGEWIKPKSKGQPAARKRRL